MLVIKLRRQFQRRFTNRIVLNMFHATRQEAGMIMTNQNRCAALLMALICLLLPVAAVAQATACQIPANLPPLRAEANEAPAANAAPTTSNLLALSWSPQFCRTRAGDSQHAFQCDGRAAQFGFILHGLWPDGPGRNDPAWCGPAKPLPVDLLRKNLCMMPSVSLQQHEWAKHGTCITSEPSRYFRAASILYDALKWPDMDRLSRARPSVGRFVAAFVAANRGLPANAVRVATSGGGWLQEVHICLDTSYKPRACPRDERGASPRSALKIWRHEK
jgi:ribonuclease T2